MEKASASLKYIAPSREVKQMHHITPTNSNSPSNSLSSQGRCSKSLLKVHIFRFWRTHPGKDDFPLVRRRTVRPFSSKTLVQDFRTAFFLSAATFCHLLHTLELEFIHHDKDCCKVPQDFVKALYHLHSKTVLQFLCSMWLSSEFPPELCIAISQHPRSQ